MRGESRPGTARNAQSFDQRSRASPPAKAATKRRLLAIDASRGRGPPGRDSAVAVLRSLLARQAEARVRQGVEPRLRDRGGGHLAFPEGAVLDAAQRPVDRLDRLLLVLDQRQR